MKIIDTTNKPEHLAFLETAWKELPPHWQRAMEKAVPAGVEIISPLKIIRRIKKKDVVWVYHPINHPLRMFTSTGMEALMAFLHNTDEGQQIYCSWRFRVNFVSPKFYFQKHFLRTLAMAVYLQQKELRKIVSKEADMEKDSVEAELFFGDTFYKWRMYERSEGSRSEERYGYAMSCLDRIDKKFLTYLNNKPS